LIALDIFQVSSRFIRLLKIKIKEYLNLWHKIHVSIKELENTFIYNKINPYNKYLKNVNTANLFNNLRKYHQYIKSYYLEKYCKNINILLDVGSAHLKSLKFRT
jgi:CRISPR-associated protein Cas8b1/Cst1 subtype I-B